MRDRQRAQQQRVDQPEGRRAGPDPERQRQDRRPRSDLPLRELSPTEDGIGAYGIEPCDPPDVEALLPMPQHRPERSPSLGRIAAMLDRIRHVGLQFFLDFAAQAIAAKYIRHAVPDRHFTSSSKRHA